MAREDTSVPQIGNTVRVGDMPMAHADPSDFGSAQGLQGLAQGIGQAGQDLGQVTVQNAERSAMAWSAQAVGQAHSDMLGQMETMKNSAQPGAPGFTQDFAKQFDDYSTQMIQNAPTVAAKQFAADRMGTLRARMVDSAQYYQENEQSSYQLNQYQKGIQDSTNAAVKDPSQLPTLMATMKATYADAPMPQAIKRHLDEQVQQMPYAVMDAQTESNPAAAHAILGQSIGINGAPGTMQDNGGANAPRGLRNNNPGNIKTSDVQWEGKVGSDGTYEQFATPEAGVRAGMVNLMHTIRSTDGTLSGVISKWAPSNENNTQAYISDVSQKSRVAPDATLDAGNKTQMSSVLSAMFQHENNGQQPADQAMQTGIDAAYGQAKLPKAGANPAGPTDTSTGNFSVDAIPVSQRIALYNKANAQLEKGNVQFRQQVDMQQRDDTAQAMTGQPVNAPLGAAAFTRAYGDVEGVARYKDYTDNLHVGQMMNSWYTATPDQIADQLSQLKPQSGPGYAHDYELYGKAQSAAVNVITAMQKDPQTFAQQHQLGPQVSLDLSQAQQPDQITKVLGDGLKQQVNTARTMTQTRQVPFQPLTAPQAAYLGAWLNQADPNSQVAALKGITGASTDPAETQAIYKQLKVNTPVVAKAGELMALGDTSDTPAVLVQGNALMKSKGAETYVGKAGAFNDAFSNAMGNAYAGQPQERAQDVQAVEAYYAAKQAASGKTAAAGMPVDNDLLNQSIQAVVGSKVNFGAAPTIAPHGMDADRFTSQVTAAWPGLMKQFGISQDVPPSATHLMRLSDGEYAVMLGNGPLKTTKGQPVAFNINGYQVMPGFKNHVASPMVAPAGATQQAPDQEADSE